MKNLAGLMKQAQQMQIQDAGDAGQAGGRWRSTGEAGAGLVKVTLNGKSDLRADQDRPKLVDPAEMEMLQDLIVAAHATPRRKIEAVSAEEMQKVTGGMQLPAGMKLPF